MTNPYTFPFIPALMQIPYDVDWRKLKDIFRLAGEVTHTDILMDNKGKSKGSATVTFESIVEAVNAICILYQMPFIVKSYNEVKGSIVPSLKVILKGQQTIQQGMELVSSFKMNTVTENYWLIYAAVMVTWPYHVVYYFQSLS